MKSKTAFLRAPLLAAAIACSAALLPAQDAYRELGATPPPAAEASPAKKASYSSQPGKNTTTARISFSDRSKPGTLKINMTVAEIDIEGTSGNEIIVTSSLDQKGAPKTDDDGFRRLDREQAFELIEKDNVATLRIAGGSPRFAAGAEFKIKVPRNTNLSIRTQSVEGVEIDDIDGDIEVSSTSGEISLENISGSVVANTMSGKIDAEFKRAPQKPVSLTSMSGAIELSLPPKTAANLRMRTLSGAIRTNFPESALKTTTETRADAKARKVSMQVTHDGDSNVTVVTSNSGDSYAFSTTTGEAQIPPPAAPSDGELVETIIETRKAQAFDYADKGLAAAQKGIAAAIQAIDGIKGLSDEEKELIKRKIQAGGNAMPRTVRVTGMPSVGGKTITGALNGGGIDIQLTTMSGPITLKQEK
ncbi:hypothetical protein M2447_001780 [Ereboglobus sp. PH5-10]|uniref:DUF4097 family beta strand repeat-containing protein n=1 Tax=Ereboglobus sp. PH5-10 TaxID=2940629 RepID=UPI0024072B0E|nr:DUF4097 family beta strand repeat-containing protein [Ereboglobus sp. PH5-10]MDF9827681.1 hypothetical protein [Ereboglobus sp. PH5-10]